MLRATPRPVPLEPDQTRSVAGIEVSLKHFRSADASGWHRHAGVYGCLMLLGDVREDKGNGEIELGRGDFTWRPPRARHRFQCGPRGAKVLTFELPEGKLGHLADHGLHLDRFRKRRSGIAAGLGHRLRAELLLEAEASSLTLESLVLDLLAESTAAFDDSPKRIRPRWLGVVRDKLHEEEEERLPLARLALEAGVHPIHLARTFRQGFGLPLGVYHRRLRLDRALHHLMETDRSLSEIALAFGFYDQSHFSNAVKRAIGTSPAQLRRLRISQGEPEDF